MNKQELLGVAITIVVVALLVFTMTSRMSQPAESIETIKVAAEAANSERCDKYASIKVIAPVDTASATSGKLFKGEKIASFTGERKFAKVTDLTKEAKNFKHHYKLDPLICDKWAVVTTIFDPTTAIRRQAMIPGWCLVVVGDKKGPVNFQIEAPLKNYVFLTAARQQEMETHFAVVAALPWNHFGRKNVGYLYAILHGAKVVWDFDDDNQLINEKHTFTIPGFSNSTTLNPNELFPAKEPDASSYDSLVFNPYPLMSTRSPFWPRGFPLDRIKSNSSSLDHVIALTDVTPKASDIGIIQSLANHDPDVDAIYRLTQPLPVDFPTTGPTVLVPKGSYSPYNAQATLTMYNALWSLLLPVTIHGRVTDIWRGYAAQRIGIDFGMRLAFSPPVVEHYRNSHNYLADFESEGPLYSSAMRLVEQINEWHSTAATIPGRIEDLWILMYEHGYIGVKDVELVQAWLISLISAGYKFPAITNPTAINSSHNHRRLRVGCACAE